MRRRTFLGAALAPLLQAQQRLPVRKAVLYAMLPGDLSIEDRFRLAADCGFAEVECPTIEDPAEAERMGRAAAAAKLRIHSVMNQAHWEFPLSSGDPQVVAKSVAGMKTSLENARVWGADTVLLVPAVVNAETSYADAWKRSQDEIRKLLPLAERYKVIIAVEEVWNKFLLSPLEFARYVDEFQSPWVRAYFDVGNVVLYGFPQDWIRTLGKRIVKLHLKDFVFRNSVAQFVPLREGQIDWKQIHRALSEIGYAGSATVELRGGDAPYLRDVSHRVDLILEGK